MEEKAMRLFVCIKCFRVWDELGNEIHSDILAEVIVECDELSFIRMFCINCSNWWLSGSVYALDV